MGSRGAPEQDHRFPTPLSSPVAFWLTLKLLLDRAGPREGPERRLLCSAPPRRSCFSKHLQHPPCNPFHPPALQSIPIPISLAQASAAFNNPCFPKRLSSGCLHGTTRVGGVAQGWLCFEENGDLELLGGVVCLVCPNSIVGGLERDAAGCNQTG